MHQISKFLTKWLIAYLWLIKFSKKLKDILKKIYNIEDNSDKENLFMGKYRFHFNEGNILKIYII